MSCLGDRCRPINDIIANVDSKYPADIAPYSLASQVAKLGDKPPAIAIATLYPIATDVNLASTGNDSTIHAHIGPA